FAADFFLSRSGLALRLAVSPLFFASAALARCAVACGRADAAPGTMSAASAVASSQHDACRRMAAAAHAGRMDAADVPTIKSFPVLVRRTFITRGVVEPSLGCRRVRVPIAPRRYRCTGSDPDPPGADRANCPLIATRPP